MAADRWTLSARARSSSLAADPLAGADKTGAVAAGRECAVRGDSLCDGARCAALVRSDHADRRRADDRRLAVGRLELLQGPGLAPAFVQEGGDVGQVDILGEISLADTAREQE